MLGHDTNRGPARALLRLFHGLALLAVVAGTFLLFDDLDRNGSTWDERVDFRIARNFVLQRSLTKEVSDPSQSRLPHILAALSIAQFGTSLWAFKLPSALAGLFAGLLLFAFLALRHGAIVGLYALAFFLTNPWVLGSSRTGATAGDILVVVTTFAFLWAAIRVFEAGEETRHPLGRTACLGLLTGISIGAKLTSVVLFPAGLALVAVMRRSVLHAVVFSVLALLTTVALHPLLVTHTDSTLNATMQAFGRSPIALEGAYSGPAAATAPIIVDVEPVEVENTPKLRYLYFLLVGKLTLPFVLLVGLGVVLGLATAWRTRRIDPAFFGALAFVLAPCVVLIWKYKQNASYFLPLLIPAITLAAIPLARGLRSAVPWHRLCVAAVWLAIVGYQLRIDVDLAPDYLQAGRRLGPAAQGQMAGPATNHCQGSPILFDRLNQLRRGGYDFDVFYVFEPCIPLILDDSVHGPVPLEGYRFRRYAQGFLPRSEHLLAVHEVIHLHRYGLPQHANNLRALQRATADCTWLNADAPHERFKLYRCPERR